MRRAHRALEHLVQIHQPGLDHSWAFRAMRSKQLQATATAALSNGRVEKCPAFALAGDPDQGTFLQSGFAIEGSF
jgi:hypothetical protein